jgi:uncharacterized protein YmfQ (DUF2313 family)
VGYSDGLAARRAALVARITAQGGQSRAYYISVAARLGYSVTITEYRPARYSDDYSGGYNGEPWAHAWQINAPQTTIVDADYANATYDDRYRSWGNAALECIMTRLKPAHTYLFFSYA